MRSSLLVVIALSGLSVISGASAGPWIFPGDSGLRSDIQVLADAGIIRGAVTTWPLAWGDILNSLDESVANPSPEALAALGRLKRRAEYETGVGQPRLNAYGAIANPQQIRSFENTPREDAEIGVGFQYTGDWFATSLQGRWVKDPADGDDFRFDDSYVGVALGNWMLAAAATDRWWGPGWQGSLIMSSNARPIPAITLERNLTTPFETKWLRWMGHWDLSVMYGFLEKERVVPNAHLFAVRLNFRPLKSLEIGISRSGMWCGDGQPCDFDAFVDMLFRGDADSDNDPNQIGGWDARWSPKIFGQQVAFYGQFIGEDANRFFPTQWLGLIGGETSGYADRFGTWRLFLEWSDTECNFRLYTSLRNDLGGDNDTTNPGCAYNHSTYRTGYRYKGRPIGHTFDSDSSIFTLGGVLTGHQDHYWLLTIGIGNLNRRNALPTTTAENKTRYRDIELAHRRSLWIGSLSVGLGYDYRKDTVTGVETDDVRAFLRYQLGY